MKSSSIKQFALFLVLGALLLFGASAFANAQGRGRDQQRQEDRRRRDDQQQGQAQQAARIPGGRAEGHAGLVEDHAGAGHPSGQADEAAGGRLGIG